MVSDFVIAGIMVLGIALVIYIVYKMGDMNGKGKPNYN